MWDAAKFMGRIRVSKTCDNCNEKAQWPYAYCLSCRAGGIGMEDDSRAEGLSFEDQVRSILDRWKSSEIRGPDALGEINALVMAKSRG